MKKKFGEYLGKLLSEHELSLRELARLTGIDPSNLSKIERGVMYPPRKQKILDKIAKAFGLNKKDRERLYDYAAHDNGIISPDLEEIKKNTAVPLLLRAINNKRLSEKQVGDLVDIINKENTWQGEHID